MRFYLYLNRTLVFQIDDTIYLYTFDAGNVDFIRYNYLKITDIDYRKI